MDAWARQFIEHIVQTVLANRAPELKILERDLTKLESDQRPVSAHQL